jgi:hypothetical protein
MKIFKLQDHLKDAAAAADVAGVYWSSRDIDSIAIGNHHFFTFVYEDEKQAARIADLGIAETFSEENDKGVRINFATLGVDKDRKSKGIIIKSSPKSDRKSIKEISKEENTNLFSYDYDFQGHRVPREASSIPFASDEELMAAISEKTINFNNHFNIGDIVEYSLVDENCACVVNSIMRVLGFPKKVRRELGEFWGVDWGEEDVIEDRYFEKVPYIGNKNSKELHAPNCKLIRRIKEENRATFTSIEEALAQGYNGCHYCLDEYDTD